MWASLQKQTVALIGDLNMDRLKPNEREGKIPIARFRGSKQYEIHDIQVHTRITPNSSTLLDVILTNTPKLFRKCRVYDPAISDHYLIHGIIKENVCKNTPK